jgi:hypothetical protein
MMTKNYEEEMALNQIKIEKIIIKLIKQTF